MIDSEKELIETIFSISFNKFSELLLAFTCARAIGNLWIIWLNVNLLTLFRWVFSGSTHGYGGGGQAKRRLTLKICHTYPTKMKLGTVIPCLKKIQKYIINVTQPLSSADINIFSLETSKFCNTRNIDIDCFLIYNF